MNDDELIKRVTAQLEASSERLDGATRSQLTQARHRALTSRHHKVWIWPAAGGVVLASLVAVMVWTTRGPDINELNSANDFEMLTESDGIELYQELEFLQWLEEEESNGVV